MQENNISLKNNNPVISIIVPVYRVERYLNDCVDSILNQTYKNIEIILIDDDSPDRCPLICDEYAAKDERVIVIHKKNGGLRDARNVGINAATGDYIIFVDSDDKLADFDAVTKVIAFFQNKNIDIIYCPLVIRMDEKSNTENLFNFQNDYSVLTPNELLKFANKNHYIFAAWSFIVRRSYILDHSIYFYKDLLHEDVEWIPRLLFAEENLKIGIFSEPYYIYRYNPNSITSSFNQARFESFKIILYELLKTIKITSKNYFYNTWFNSTLYSLFICFEEDCLNSSEFYKSNIGTVKQFFKENYKFLNFRNRILYIFIKLNPKLFFILRKWVKKVLGR